MRKLILLKTEKDYERFRKSRSYRTPAMTVRWIRNPNQNSSRFGFIVPKKVLPKVTDRNKVKRRFKHLVLSRLGNIAKADLLFFPGKSTLKKKYSVLENEFVDLIKRAGLWVR